MLQNINDYQVIQLDLIVKPLRLLTAIRFNYARKYNVSLHQVQLEANFIQAKDLQATKMEDNDDTFLFSRVTMLGAKWDFDQNTLTEKNVMHQYESHLGER